MDSGDKGITIAPGEHMTCGSRLFETFELGCE